MTSTHAKWFRPLRLGQPKPVWTRFAEDPNNIKAAHAILMARESDVYTAVEVDDMVWQLWDNLQILVDTGDKEATECLRSLLESYHNDMEKWQASNGLNLPPVQRLWTPK